MDQTNSTLSSITYKTFLKFQIPNNLKPQTLKFQIKISHYQLKEDLIEHIWWAINRNWDEFLTGDGLNTVTRAVLSSQWVISLRYCHCPLPVSSKVKKFSSWLEYSPEKDAAYCLPCYLFGKHYGARNDGKNAFSELGFSNWKKVNNGVNCAFVCHEGSIPNSPHNLCVKSCDDLMAQSKHIAKVLDRHSDETITNNRLRLKTSINAIRWLAFQNVHNVVLENALGNAQYISPSAQKDILHIFARKVRATIREEIGDSKFCIIIDEARDESKREQMSVVLRFVDKHGCVQERFFDLIHVSDTCSLTLKTEISSVLSRHNLDVQNLRGQGYDRASNMRGEWNGLQALFLKDCPFAYYIHCLAHRLQLALVSVAKELRVAQANNVANLITNDQIVTGSGLNQIGTLQRAGDTRWGSHLNSVRSLLCMFDATCEVLEKKHRRRGRTRKIVDQISVEHHYHVNLFLAVIDTQLQELNGRFNDNMMELLTLSSTLDPRDNYKFFGVNKLCQGLTKTGKSLTYPLIDRLIRLVLTLPVSTATTERSFSTMNIVKNRFRNKMEDELLANCLLIYIEKKIAERFDTDSIIDEFYDTKNRRVPLR
ncbi:uncharacterized protein LOC107485624 [Arachis duranensis]|uniref:Uncharacterized protein LOC107485624 n=1 Tax=Arachis duranensis TaxID=130453 RepID=A0A6P4D385_ARADU|nr:uncharacterized protein LOC107485624 [Arachis duranensis]